RVEDLAFAPDGRTLLAAGPGSATSVWTVVDSDVRTRLGGFDVPTRSLAFGPDGLLALGMSQGAVGVWQAGRCVVSAPHSAPAPAFGAPPGRRPRSARRLGPPGGREGRAARPPDFGVASVRRPRPADHPGARRAAGLGLPAPEPPHRAVVTPAGPGPRVIRQ